MKQSRLHQVSLSLILILIFIIKNKVGGTWQGDII